LEEKEYWKYDKKGQLNYACMLVGIGREGVLEV